MWPRRGRREVLRVGRHQVERWRRNVSGLELIGHRAVESSGPELARSGLASLQQACEALWQDETPTTYSTDVVVESAWLPLLQLEIGTAWRSMGQIELLMRHRLALLHDDRWGDLSTWDVRIEHRPGDVRGIGYALSPLVLQALTSAVAASGQTIASLQPAFAWGWEEGSKARRWASGKGWWVWREQDRDMVALVERGRVRAINAGVEQVRNDDRWPNLLAAEAVRCGVSGALGPIVVAGWQPTDASLADAGGSPWTWFSAAGQGAALIGRAAA